MKNAVKITVTCLLAAGVAACGPKAVGPRFGMLEVDTVFRAGALDYRVQYEFATIVNASRASALEAIEQANVGHFFSLEGFSGTARQAASQAIALLADENARHTESDAGRALWSAEITVSSEARVVDTVLVYIIGYSSYTGGAHGTYGQSVHNYSIAGGYELELSDLFDAQQLERLRPIIREKLCERFGVKSDEGLVEQGIFPEYIDVTDNFAPTDAGGLIFYYNPYDIGCHAVGSVEVELGRDEIEALIR